MARRDDIGLDIDIKGFQRSLDDIGKRALPKAAAATLNGIAFDAQRGLMAAMERDFDRPNAFTLRAFKVDKARPTDPLASMSATIRAQPAQAAYLRLQIEGGERKPGMAGVGGTKDVFTAAIRQDARGGIPRGLIKRLSRDLKAEKTARANWSEGVIDEPFEASHKPGTFFGIVGGVKGYWRRARRKGARVIGKLTRLLTIQPSARYKPRLPYNAVVESAARRDIVQRTFARELQRQIERNSRS
jgi:hypothetical protein